MPRRPVDRPVENDDELFAAAPCDDALVLGTGASVRRVDRGSGWEDGARRAAAFVPDRTSFPVPCGISGSRPSKHTGNQEDHGNLVQLQVQSLESYF